MHIICIPIADPAPFEFKIFTPYRLTSGDTPICIPPIVPKKRA